jgi:hypothetical protein
VSMAFGCNYSCRSPAARGVQGRDSPCDSGEIPEGAGPLWGALYGRRLHGSTPAARTSNKCGMVNSKCRIKKVTSITLYSELRIPHPEF